MANLRLTNQMAKIGWVSTCGSSRFSKFFSPQLAPTPPRSCCRPWAGEFKFAPPWSASWMNEGESKFSRESHVDPPPC